MSVEGVIGAEISVIDLGGIGGGLYDVIFHQIFGDPKCLVNP